LPRRFPSMQGSASSWPESDTVALSNNSTGIPYYEFFDPCSLYGSEFLDEFESNATQAPVDTIHDLPPSYSSLGIHRGSRFRTSAEAASSRSHSCMFFKEHQFHIKDGTRVWASLKVVSRVPLPESMTLAPRFIGGDHVIGMVELYYGVKVKKIYLRVSCG
jgi:hypothetical protein